jgi:hypothetical protein
MESDSAVGVTVEDITEVSWEDLIIEMVDPDAPDTLVNTASGCSSGTTFTCVTTNTLTGTPSCA